MKPLDYLLATVRTVVDRPVEDGGVAIPVFCGFVPGTVHAEHVAVDSAGKRTRGITTIVVPTEKALSECVILHTEGVIQGGIESRVHPEAVQIEVEARLRTCQHASTLIDDILRQLEADGTLRDILTRYDEPGLSETQFGAHSAVVLLPGTCPNASTD